VATMENLETARWSSKE